MQDLLTASARVGGGGGEEKRKKTKIEKAVLCSSCLFLSLCAHSYVLASLACCQIFHKKARKTSLDR